MTKFYVIMKYEFRDEAHAKAARLIKGVYHIPGLVKSDCVTEDPSNHFPSLRIKMHELQKAETDKKIIYRIISTNY